MLRSDPRRLGRTDVDVLQRSLGNRGLTEALGSPRAVQRHASYEHQILGDIPPAALRVIAESQDPAKPVTPRVVSPKGALAPVDAVHTLKNELDRLTEWKSSPPPKPASAGVMDPKYGVIPMYIEHHPKDAAPGAPVETTTLTYGEMNTLADYFGNQTQLREAKPETVRNVVGFVRTMSFKKLTDLLATLDATQADTYKKTDEYTTRTPIEGKPAEIYTQYLMSAEAKERRYLANVARNACHFAPFSWYRWRDHHTEARKQATTAEAMASRAEKTKDPKLAAKAAETGNQALVTNGFGDHYLQDSYAAGHLVNKTLVMQWYVDWLRRTNPKKAETFIGKEDWERIQRITATQQSGLAGMDLYDSEKLRHKDRRGEYDVHSNDPQTAEDQSTLEGRKGALGLKPGPGGSITDDDYRAYQAFLRNALVQKSAGDLHDRFCREGLTVLTDTDARFLLYGDFNMLKPGSADGVEYQAETSNMSRDAILALLHPRDGASRKAHTPEEIMRRLPSRVEFQGHTMSFADWHSTGLLRTHCESTVFPDTISKTNIDGFGFLAPLIGQIDVSLGGVTQGGDQTRLDKVLSGLEKGVKLVEKGYVAAVGAVQHGIDAVTGAVRAVRNVEPEKLLANLHGDGSPF